MEVGIPEADQDGEPPASSLSAPSRGWRWVALLLGLLTLLALAAPSVGASGPDLLVLVGLVAVTLAAPLTPPGLRNPLAALPPLVLAGAALWQRPEGPMTGLAVLIGTTLVIEEARAPRELVRGPGAVAAACALAFAGLMMPVELGVPRGPGLWGLAVLGTLSLLLMVPSHLGSLFDTVMASPARLLVASFAVIATLGTGLLMVPAATTIPVSLVDAAFTAVSATCVTGLAVLDTPTAFTWLGQAIILALIQVGGLGIMSFAVVGSLYLGRRLRLREEALAAELMGIEHTRSDLESAFRAVLWVTAVSEAVATVLLTGLFVHTGDGWGQALWRALFTSVSAFCNAGFALQSDSLVPYQDDPGVLLVLSALITVGSLGPLVVVALADRSGAPRSLHFRMVVLMTAILTVVPSVLWLALEWNQSLAGLGLTDRVVNALFHAVTLRTAGFNAVDLTQVRPATWTLMIVCMFIGGSPGSTAGGVKTTTFAVLLLAVVSAIRGLGQVEGFGRRLPHRVVYEAAAITTVGALAALVVLTSLQLTQQIPLDAALFEVVSALATVGLSVGATAQLDTVGKVVIIAAMFAGRVGPLTLFIFLVGRRGQGRGYPIESVPVG